MTMVECLCVFYQMNNDSTMNFRTQLKSFWNMSRMLTMCTNVVKFKGWSSASLFQTFFPMGLDCKLYINIPMVFCINAPHHALNRLTLCRWLVLRYHLDCNCWYLLCDTPHARHQWCTHRIGTCALCGHRLITRSVGELRWRWKQEYVVVNRFADIL